MRNILIIGAGKSASYLIKYFLDKSISENLNITIGDLVISNAENGLETTPMQTHLSLIFLTKPRANKRFKMQISWYLCCLLDFI